MSAPEFARLEHILQEQRPQVAATLQPGLPPDFIPLSLQAQSVSGNIQPLVELFGWKNGCEESPDLTIEEASLFPASIYRFISLGTALEHFAMLGEALAYHPKFEETNGRYFPLFWDSSNSWIVLDLHSGQVALMLTESEDLIHNPYPTLADFIADAVEANQNEEPLKCFTVF